MKKWRCTVCGYIHEGPEPPENCTVCGADRSLFEEVIEEQVPAREAAEVELTEKKWRCTVCGYIHKGPEPPEKCPVCGSGKSLFEEVIEPSTGIGEGLQDAAGTGQAPEAPAAGSPSVTGADDSGPLPAASPGGLFQLIVGQMLKHHVHPVSVHIPNGVLPVSVIFIILAVFSGSESLQTAALYNMAFVVLTIPLVLFSGYIEWRNRYKGALTLSLIHI